MASMFARQTVSPRRWKMAVMSPMIMGTSSSRLMKITVQEWCTSLLEPISLPMCTGLSSIASRSSWLRESGSSMPFSKSDMVSSVASAMLASEVPQSVSVSVQVGPLLARSRLVEASSFRFAFWCRRQPTTASWTVGKNHRSPTKLARPALRKVLSKRFPTMAKAICTPLLRKSKTRSSSTWSAVESTLTTAVISSTMYSVRLICANALIRALSQSLMKKALAKYMELPIRAMKTLGTKAPLLSCFKFR
mmetsp:Transcript_134381/g.318539  ORF Transcript_134381/g.318539 Transcript_134381/m.318539 type:complete len:249 (-) Transcript_134381:1432-2178(-)